LAHPRLSAIHKRYLYRCGYCGVTETDAGGELTVDHFQPISAGGDDRDDNLVYACVRCNQYKGALESCGTDVTRQKRFLHPLLDPVSAHIREDDITGLLEGLTPTGTFHIDALRLNRSPLIANRRRWALLVLLEARLEQTRAESLALRQRLDLRDRYIADLEERLNDSSRE